MTKVDLRRRSMQSELLDTEPVEFAEFHKCLQELEVINICTLAYRPTMRWARHTLESSSPSETVFVLDISSGGGDMLLRNSPHTL